MNITNTALTSSVGGITISHPFVEQKNAEVRKLLVIIPGKGYTLERPLLYYLTRCGIEIGYDVLNIRFSFQITNSEVDFSVLAEEITLVLEQLPDHDYREVVIAGKSLGTLLIPLVVSHFESIPCKRILLTPLDGSSQLNDDLPTLGIIGTADTTVDISVIVVHSHNNNHRWVPYERLNHSLEDEENWERSVDHLKLIIRDCAHFLQS